MDQLVRHPGCKVFRSSRSRIQDQFLYATNAIICNRGKWVWIQFHESRRAQSQRFVARRATKRDASQLRAFCEVLVQTTRPECLLFRADWSTIELYVSSPSWNKALKLSNGRANINLMLVWRKKSSVKSVNDWAAAVAFWYTYIGKPIESFTEEIEVITYWDRKWRRWFSKCDRFVFSHLLHSLERHGKLYEVSKNDFGEHGDSQDWLKPWQWIFGQSSKAVGKILYGAD